MTDRIERLQIMLDSDELEALDDWRQESSSFGVLNTDGADASFVKTYKKALI